MRLTPDLIKVCSLGSRRMRFAKWRAKTKSEIGLIQYAKVNKEIMAAEFLFILKLNFSFLFILKITQSEEAQGWGIVRTNE